MATNFPTSLDTFPSAATLATHQLSTDPHSALHGNLGDSVAALEAKVGVDGSAVVTSLDYLAKRPQAPNGRLTLTTAVPITTADVTAAGTVYYTPYNGNSISLYDTTATKWFRRTFAEVSASLSGLTSLLPADVFAYLSAGTLTLEVLNWTNGTTRATALALQDGVWVKSGDATRLYLGTVCGSGAGTCDDSNAKRLVSNCFNRTSRAVKALEGGTTWTYGTQAFRPFNNDDLARFHYVSGLGDTVVDIVASGRSESTIAAARYVGLGIGSTTVDGSDCQGQTAANFLTNITATWRGYQPAGYQYYQPLEYGSGSGTQTWYGYSITGTFGSCTG